MRTLGPAPDGRARGGRARPTSSPKASPRSAPGSTRPPTTRPLPAEFQLLRTGFEPWAPADSLTIAKLLAFGLSTNWERELLRAEMARELGAELAAQLDPGYPARQPGGAHPGRGVDGRRPGPRRADRAGSRHDLGLAVEATGSNNWAVSGGALGDGRSR